MGDAIDTKESSFNSWTSMLPAPKPPSLIPDRTQACESQNNRDFGPQLQHNFLSVIKHDDFRRSRPRTKARKEKEGILQCGSWDSPTETYFIPISAFLYFFFFFWVITHHKIAARLRGGEEVATSPTTQENCHPIDLRPCWAVNH